MLSRLSPAGLWGRRRFADLSEREILALAISAEEEDSRIYAAYAAKLRAEFPGSAAVFDGMATEEDEHRRRLVDVYRRRFGDSWSAPTTHGYLQRCPLRASSAW